MPADNDALARAQELLKKLWEQHKGTIFERLAILEQGSASATALDQAARSEVCSVAHKLAGSLGTFGFTQGSVWAKDSERILQKAQIEPADQQQLLDNAKNIRALIESPPVS